MLINNSEIKIRPANNADCENVQKLVFRILDEYGLKPDLPGTDKDITDIEANYINRGGVFEILEDANGNLLGTVGLFPIDDETIELRKMYFSKAIRGRGLGKKTLQKMIETAKKLGYNRIFLETANVLKEAIGLYESFGFTSATEKHTPRCDRSFYYNL